MPDPHETIRWGHHALELEIGLGEHGTPAWSASARPARGAPTRAPAHRCRWWR